MQFYRSLIVCLFTHLLKAEVSRAQAWWFFVHLFYDTMPYVFFPRGTQLFHLTVRMLKYKLEWISIPETAIYWNLFALFFWGGGTQFDYKSQASLQLNLNMSLRPSQCNAVEVLHVVSGTRVKKMGGAAPPFLSRSSDWMMEMTVRLSHKVEWRRKNPGSPNYFKIGISCLNWKVSKK